jgi:hypothetical protein
MKILAQLKHEFLSIIPTAVFFFFAFQLLAFTQALILEEYGIQVTTFLAAAIGALIVAKVVLIVDMLPFVNRFPDKPLIYNVIWKTIIYLIAAFIVRYLEHLFDFFREYHDIIAANKHLLDQVIWSHFWVVQIWLAVLFLMYCTLRELVRALGREQIRTLFLGSIKPSGA